MNNKLEKFNFYDFKFIIEFFFKKFLLIQFIYLFYILSRYINLYFFQIIKYKL